MTTQRKLNLINGVKNKEGGILTYRATSCFKIGGCEPGVLLVPPLPFPDDDDDWYDSQ